MTTSGASLEQLMSRISDQITAARDNAVRMAEVVGRGEAEEGRVVVTVRPTGAVQDVELDPRAMRLPSVDLAAAIVAAARLAERDAAAQVREIFGGLEMGGLDMADVAQGRADLTADLDTRLAAAHDALRKYR